MVQGGLPPSARRDTLIVSRKKQRPLIRYAGSAAETSIGSKPIGSELSAQFYPWCNPCQVKLKHKRKHYKSQPEGSGNGDAGD